jgi:hypothetical protein
MIATRDEAGRRQSAAFEAAGWLGLAAAPTFAAMAALTFVAGGDAEKMCSTVHAASPLGGMAPMYVLMSAFHAAPWLRVIWRRRSAGPRKCSRMSCCRRTFAIEPGSVVMVPY